MKVRPATLADVNNVVTIGKSFFEQTRQAKFTEYNPEGTAALIESLVTSPEGAVFVAELDDGEVVGICGGLLFPLWMSADHKTGQELFWYVEPDHRKSKAGKLLFDALEQWAKDSGANSFNMIALSHLHEKRVGQMYESKGYVPLERSYVKEL